jgi:ABC-2 type transport system permease protein
MNADDAQGILVRDETRYFTPEFAESAGVTLVDDAGAAEAEVRDGRAELLVVYPENPLEEQIRVYNRDGGLFNNSKYENTAKGLLIAAINASLTDPVAGAILTNSANIGTSVTAYRDGEVTDMAAMVVPLVCLAVLFLAVMMCSNTILVATTEEKENRITEMILTTIKSRTLIIGKICAQWVLMLIQMALLVLPLVVAMIVMPQALPFNLGSIPIDPLTLVMGIALALGGIALFTGLGFAIGAAVPTAKEASSFFGFVILLFILPMFFITQILAEPGAVLVTVLTYFPLTAPMVILMRSAVETLPIVVPIAGVVITFATALVVMLLAARIFQYGNLAYARRLSLKEILFRKARA